MRSECRDSPSKKSPTLLRIRSSSFVVTLLHRGELYQLFRSAGKDDHVLNFNHFGVFKAILIVAELTHSSPCPIVVSGEDQPAPRPGEDWLG